jgi:cell division protein FtsQ
MARSFAVRAPVGRLPRPLTLALPRGATARRLGIALAALALLGGGWLWLRDSPLVAVEHVQIAGVQGPDAAVINAALRAAARRQSTLDVNVGALRAAVAPFRVVRGLSVHTSFPHGLRIRVAEQLPVAVLTVGGVRTAVAADGVVLGPGMLSSSLPALTAAPPALAAGGSPLRSGRVQDATVRAELSVLGAAPSMLLGWVERVYESREGLTVAMRGGLLLYFGDATRPHAKWLSAARVLADPSSAGATYVDVRAPERPAAGTTAAGGLQGSAAPGGVSASDPTSAALARTLEEAVAGDSGVNTAPAAASATALSSPTAAGARQGSAATAGAQEAAQAASSTTPQEAAPTASQATPQETPSTTSPEPSSSTSG